jgi:predicted enzyme related to lactoylglutathione lyase
MVWACHILSNGILTLLLPAFPPAGPGLNLLRQDPAARKIGRVAEVSVFRPGDVSYLRIAAPDTAASAAFYRSVFGWKVRKDSGGFEDATGHVIGHFMADLPVAGEAGVVPYIYVQDIDETLARVTGARGRVSAGPYPEGDLWVAMTRDPAGNAIGVWQRGPRPGAG